FFVWQLAEFERVLGDDAALAQRHFGVSAEGNWEHTNVLWRAIPVEKLAEQQQADPGEIAAQLQRAREKLLAARESRVRPGTDDKVLAAWNGMMIQAFAQGHQVLGDARYLR